jgi:hypothetical protein
MVAKVKPALVILVCLVVGDPAVLSSLAQITPKEDKRAKQLQSERQKLDRTRDPADRAESLMKIAEIQLSYVGEAAKVKDYSMMRLYLDQYRQAVSDARDTMMASGFDPYKKPKGYKTVELAIRKHLRVLEDTARTLTLEQRKPVEDVIDTASKIRDEFLRALFP